MTELWQGRSTVRAEVQSSFDSRSGNKAVLEKKYVKEEAVLTTDKIMKLW